jgi:hypothetical protein
VLIFYDKDLKIFDSPNLVQICSMPILPLTMVKGKEIPREAWTGPEGSRKLRLPDLKTIGT